MVPLGGGAVVDKEGMLDILIGDVEDGQVGGLLDRGPARPKISHNRTQPLLKLNLNHTLLRRKFNLKQARRKIRQPSSRHLSQSRVVDAVEDTPIVAVALNDTDPDLARYQVLHPLPPRALNPPSVLFPTTTTSKTPSSP